MATTVFKNDTYLAWKGPMAIDCDGAPNAYGPPGKPGLDYLANAGSDGNWYGIVTDNGLKTGRPIVQGPNDPFPGMYIAATSLRDHSKNPHDPTAYVDASKIPYLVVPGEVIEDHEIHVGDVGLCYNVATKLWAAGIVADVGPHRHYGEGSICMAKTIGIKNASPRNGGVDSGIIMVVFKNTAKGWPRPYQDISDQVKALLAAAGGIDFFIQQQQS